MEKIIKQIDIIQKELLDLNKFLYENPELGNEEYKAYSKLTDILENHHFDVQREFIGIPTAFKATYASNKAGPTIAYMAEYDALPGIGHGCGHNMIATIAIGTGIVLSKLVDEIGGTVIVLGTPAEENDGAKVDMVASGVFEEIDVALIAHPSTQSVVRIECLAMEAIEFEFLGKTAHAAANPDKGINALDGVIGLFNSVNALREHLLSSTRVHGIITEGGLAANIVPERAVAQFYVRATEKEYLKDVVEKVKNCARGSALATGTKLNMRNYEKSYDNMLPNFPLIQLVEKHFNAVDLEGMTDKDVELGSADAGNVSYVCPTVHPLFAIANQSIAGHTLAFADATQTSFALDQMKKVIVAFVQTGLDIMSDTTLLEAIKLNKREC